MRVGLAIKCEKIELLDQILANWLSERNPINAPLNGIGERNPLDALVRGIVHSLFDVSIL